MAQREAAQGTIGTDGNVIVMWQEPKPGTPNPLLLNWTVADYMDHFFWSWEQRVDPDYIQKNFPITCTTARLLGNRVRDSLIHPEDLYWLQIKAIQTGTKLPDQPPPPF